MAAQVKTASVEEALAILDSYGIQTDGSTFRFPVPLERGDDSYAFETELRGHGYVATVLADGICVSENRPDRGVAVKWSTSTEIYTLTDSKEERMLFAKLLRDTTLGVRLKRVWDEKHKIGEAEAQQRLIKTAYIIEKNMVNPSFLRSLIHRKQ